MNSFSILCQSVIELCLSIQLPIDEGMASSAINPIDLFLDLGQLGSQFLQHLFGGRFPSHCHFPITLVMAFNASFSYHIKVVLLFCWHTAVAINTFDDIQFVTRSLLDADASLSLNEPLNIYMTILAFNFLHPLTVMAFRTILHKRFAVVFTGSVATQTFQPFPEAVGFMGKFYVVKSDGPLLYSNVAEGRAGYSGLKFLWFIIFVNGGQGLFGLIVRRIEKFENIFNIVNTLAQKDKAVIVPNATMENR